MGGDGAYSCKIDDNRVLWLFGDSLIAKDATRSRDASWFIRNSAAIQTGLDPSRAFMAFFWGPKDGHPGSFVPEQSDRWFWPGACVRVGKGALIFGQWLREEGTGQWGFGAEGSASFFIPDTRGDPPDWQLQDAHITDFDADAIFGTAAFATNDYVFVYGTKGTTHDYMLARYTRSDADRGDLTHGTFFQNGRWVPGSDLDGSPAAIFTLGAPESSVHWDADRGQFAMVQSEGFGATTLAIRFAPEPEGPWSTPVSFYRPPESYDENAFVYAGKAHSEIAGGGLAVSYVPSRFEDDPRPSPADFYYPHFVRVRF